MTPRELELRDEVLQVLFWLRGENFGDHAGIDELAVWIAAASGELEPVLQAMLQDGYLKQTKDDETYGLSEFGLEEGGRRFTENFVDSGLGSQGHGVCSDDCDCHTLGPEHCSQHHHAAQN